MNETLDFWNFASASSQSRASPLAQNSPVDHCGAAPLCGSAASFTSPFDLRLVSSHHASSPAKIGRRKRSVSWKGEVGLSSNTRLGIPHPQGKDVCRSHSPQKNHHRYSLEAFRDPPVGNLPNLCAKNDPGCVGGTTSTLGANQWCCVSADLLDVAHDGRTWQLHNGEDCLVTLATQMRIVDHRGCCQRRGTGDDRVDKGFFWDLYKMRR